MIYKKKYPNIFLVLVIASLILTNKDFNTNNLFYGLYCEQRNKTDTAYFYQILKSNSLKQSAESLISQLSEQITSSEFLFSRNFEKIKLVYLKQYLRKFKYYYVILLHKTDNELNFCLRKETNKEINQLAIETLYIIASI